MKIIGLCGKMGSGKDTIAKIILKNKLVDDKISFAERLKYHCRHIFGETNREYLQKLGQACREIQKDVWIDRAIDSINWTESIFKSHDANWEGVYVITDVRYPNEAEWILSQQGILIAVNTNSSIRRERIEKRNDTKISIEDWIKWSAHSSEYGFMEILDTYGLFIHVFNNNDSLNDDKLETKFLKWYEENINE